MTTCFTTVDDRIELLPYFVKYYRSIGVDHIVVSVNRGPANPLWNQVIAFSSEQPISVVHGSDAVFQDGSTDAAHTNQIRQKIEGWHVLADLDEFHYFGVLKVPEVIALVERDGADGAYLNVVDRVTKNGTFPTITGVLDELFPMQCDVTAKIGANITKAGLLKHGVNAGAAAHYAPGRMLSNGYECHHFKWSAGVVERTERRHLLWQSLPDSMAFKNEPKLLLGRLFKEPPQRLNQACLEVKEAAKLGI